jgi:TolB-like protein/DNA-binding winged helix-turn-helix (wHTH) protein/cytochrome c-type biogenesis protein CcmH/NrfG
VPAASPEGAVRFGRFEFDLATRELRNDGRKLPLQGQPAQILSHLVTAPGRIVTRDELRRAIWGDDTFVDFDTALNVAVNKLRQALGDSATSPRFIETVPRHGYRFLADVHRVESRPVLPPSSEAPVAPAPSRPNGRQWVAQFAVVLALVGLWDGIRSDPRPASPRSIAVLPFRPLIAETRDPALEMGLAEAVIIRLGRLEELRVPSIHAVRRFADSDIDSRLAGRELDVEAVLDGSFQRVHGNVRLSARLLDVSSGTALWARQWDLAWTDILTVQDRMAAEVARALALSVGEEPPSLGRHPTNLAAYDAYLRARYLLLRRSVANSRRAAELLEEAVRLDPESAAAHASLAFAYISVPLLEGPSAPFVELGRRAARRALELDKDNAEAHTVLARILVHFDWDPEASDRTARRGLEVDPTNPFVLHCYSLMLADQGRFDEALALADRALALDPASVLANRDKAIILYLARRHEASIEQSRRTLELDPFYGPMYLLLGRNYDALGQPEAAVEAYLTPLSFSETNGETVAALRGAARRGGPTEFWKVRLEYLLKESHVRPAAVAMAYVKTGDHDQAIAWLERLYAERGAWVTGLKVQPVWDPLRPDPRFQALLRRANLAPRSQVHVSSGSDPMIR